MKFRFGISFALKIVFLDQRKITIFGSSTVV